MRKVRRNLPVDNGNLRSLFGVHFSDSYFATLSCDFHVLLLTLSLLLFRVLVN